MIKIHELEKDERNRLLADMFTFNESLTKYLELSIKKLEIETELNLFKELIEHYVITNENTIVTTKLHEDSNIELASLDLEKNNYSFRLSEISRKTIKYREIFKEIQETLKNINKEILLATEKEDEDSLSKLRIAEETIKKVIKIWNENTNYPVSNRLFIKEIN